MGNSEESSALPEKKDHKAYVEAMLAALDEEEESELSEFEPDEEWKDVPEIDLADIEDAPYDEAIPENADETQWVDANIVTFGKILIFLRQHTLQYFEELRRF